ncbi:MAG: CoA transferase [Desulfobacterales bacterium]|jgi:crotonobetainyl-CoA:carnitine CoA-transferase CaiB-like acyl-CoA transferase|nr:CoA transferase [Desulfobacterales bacterium]
MSGSLEDILVLDLSRLFPGPYCSMILADHGARVIAIEDRRFEKEYMPILSNINRNKEHMTLNLKNGKGKDIFLSLAKKADVVLEGFRPGVTHRLGVGYKDIRKINPGIIYCSITGYGQTGALRNQVGHDVNYLGHSGVLSVMGPKNGPPCIPGIQVADMVGGLNGAIGIMLALHAREKTGTGQHIDVSMTDAMMAMLPFVAGFHWVFGAPPEKGNALLSHRYACYNIYQTKDAKYISLGALEPRFWEAVCHYFEVPEYIPLQFDEQRKELLIDFFKKAFLRKTRDEWMEIFSNTDTCIGRVLTVDEALDGDYSLSRNMVVKLEQPGKDPIAVLGIPIKMTANPGSIRSLPPKFGENTQPILEELGFSIAEIQHLSDEGVI